MTIPRQAIENTSQYTLAKSPVGPLMLGWGEAGMTLLVFQEGKKSLVPQPDWTHITGSFTEPFPEPFNEALRQLEAFFAGELQTFDLPLEPQGTPFQLRVWSALQSIPYGETRSYGQLAAQIGQPKAVRAVGAANGSNPLPIVIPCHRVIGGDGSLTGFGGGLAVKHQLLELEIAHCGWQPPQLSLI